jgi:2-polyprenyl-3-methyl-5-hydroxy-6-metoxy-1,4-benzoquinol methylase
MHSRLDTASPAHRFRRFALYECEACGSGFFPDLKAPAYEGKKAKTGERIRETAALKYYLEQGAGLLSMVQPLLRLPKQSGRKLLEVGCGYGFALHFAREALHWNATGFDPSSLARIGAEDLGIEIVPEYLEVGSEPEKGPFDVVYSSEVIEHVDKPETFLAPVCKVLTDKGLLVLTTPDIGGLQKNRDLDSLLPLISPGSHLVLYSRDGLTQALQRAGFSNIDMTTNGDTLIAIATNSTASIQSVADIDPQIYRDYLSRQVESFHENLQLFAGFSGRLLKEQVNNLQYSEARQSVQKIAHMWQQEYKLELLHPADLNFSDLPIAEFEAFAKKIPMNAVVVLYHTGVLTLNDSQDMALARQYFEACQRAETSLKTAFHKVNVVDIESMLLSGLASALSIGLSANNDPKTAAAALANARHRGFPPGCEIAFQNAALDVFSAAANTGDWQSARPLADEVSSYLTSIEIDDARTRTAATGLAMLALNEEFDRKTGLFWLRRALTHAPDSDPWRGLRRVWADHASARGVELLAGGGRAALAIAEDEISGGLMTRDPKPEDFDVLAALGAIHAQDDPVQAAIWLQRAQKIAPKKSVSIIKEMLSAAQVQAFLGAVATEKPKIAKQMRSHVEALVQSGSQDPGLLLALGLDALNREQNPVAALSWLQAIPEDDPTGSFAQSHDAVAIAQNQIQNQLISASASGHFGEIPALLKHLPDPLENLEAVYALAMYQLEYAKDQKQAARNFAQVSKLAPKPDLRDYARFHLSIALARSGQTAKAQKIADQLFGKEISGKQRSGLKGRKNELQAEIEGMIGA